MRFLIITYDEYINIPFIEEYERILQSYCCDYDIILWDRRELHKKPATNWYVFHADTGKSKVSKVLPFIKWKLFAHKIIKKGNYDKIIILTTIPAVLLSHDLLGRYAGKYWLDIRDFTYENVGIYKKLVGRLVMRSACTSISSPAFSCFLPPEANLIQSHNILNMDQKIEHCYLTNKKSYTIGFVGGIRYFQQNRILISALKDSGTFRLKYVGKWHKGCDLQKFCQENHIDNVEFLPEYRNDQKSEIYKSIDLINAVYGCNTEVERLALPNKLYDCAIFKKPIIVSKGTYLSDVVLKYHLGLAIDLNQDNIALSLKKYISEFDCKEFEEGCRHILNQSRIEMEAYRTAFEEFCQ